MNIKSMVALLMKNITKHTREFSDFMETPISSATVSGGRLVEVTTTAPHGLLINAPVFSINSEVKNLIESVELDGEIAIITFKAQHDFTLDSDEMQIELGGFARPAWNAKHLLRNVIDATTIEIEAPDNEIGVYTNSFVWEPRSMGANGLVVLTYVSANKFRFNIPSGSPDLPNTSLRNLEIIKGFRISGVSDAKKSMKIWSETEQKSWLFVMFPDDFVSKNQNSQSDMVGTFTDADDGRLRIGENIDISAIIPIAENDLGGVEAVYKANGEIRDALIATIYGYKEEGADFTAVYNGSSMFLDNSAIYIRVYSFQVPYDITFDDTDRNNPETVAFREMLLKMAISENPDATKLEVKVTL